MQRIARLAASILLLAGGACRREDAASVSTEDQDAPAPRWHDSQDAPAARWRDPDRYEYDVELSSSAEVASNAVPVAFVLSARLVLRTRSSGATTSFVAGLRDVHVRVLGDARPSSPPGLEAELEGPWGFDVVGGRAESLRVRGGANPFALAILSTLAAAFQHPTGPSEDGLWQADETDGMGHYQARYARGAEPGAFVKTKVGYEKVSLKMATRGPLSAMEWTPAVIASRGELRFRGDDLLALRWHDEIELGMTPSLRLHSTTDLAITLRERVSGAGAPDWQSLWASTSVVALGAPIRSDQPARALDASRASRVTFAEALAALETQSTPGPGRSVSPMAVQAPDVATAREQLGSFGTIVAVLRSRPEDVPLAVAAIGRGSPARPVLLDALGAAATPAAQAALSRLMLDRGAPEEVRRHAAFALIRTPRPTAASLDALVDALGDPLARTYAVYGLGTYARRFREAGEAALASRAAARLVEELPVATRSLDRVDVLRGIANSGDARAFAAVRPLLDERDESVRTAAISAVRLMPNPEVDGILAKHLTGDESMGVRVEALDAASVRAPTDALVEAVGRVAIGAPDSRSRMMAVRVLASWMPSRPDVRSVLQRAARGDPRDPMREAARAALGE